MEPLHLVTKDELPILLEWTAKHLPYTSKIYETIKSELKGLWDGPAYYTLGWPEILAVGEGPVDPAKCKCAAFFNELRHTCVFSPNNEHLEQLITRPEFLDWTKPIMFVANSHENMDAVERVSLATGTIHSKRFVNYFYKAEPGTIPIKPLPDGLEIRRLDPNLHTDYVTSTWHHRRPNTEMYVREILTKFPSVGIFDRDGNCAGFEVLQEFGFGGLLYVEEKFRGRGLASCLISHLAQIRFQDNEPYITAAVVYNTPSVKLHAKVGLESVCKLDWFIHTMTSEKIINSQ